MTGNAKLGLTLKVLPDLYGIVKLAQDAPIPDWANGQGLSAMIRADDELTLVCPQDRIPANVNSVIHWRCLRSVGPFAFDTSGIVLSIIAPLSNQGIGVFVICTFDGEHVLVADAQWEESLQRLKEAGHCIID